MPRRRPKRDNGKFDGTKKCPASTLDFSGSPVSSLRRFFELLDDWEHDLAGRDCADDACDDRAA